jgi:solute carrier family 25 oxoglutarate transporter 11
MEFLLGGAAGMTGWLFAHPMDVVKIQMQLAGEGAKEVPKHYRSIVSATIHIAKENGFKAFYKGLSAALTRQAVYTTCRLGLYNTLMKQFSSLNKSAGSKAAVVRVGCGLTAGAISSFICCPVEVCLVRMQADISEPDPLKRRNYKHIGNALTRISREEGVRMFFRGATPTVLRAMMVNAVQLATYDQAKYMYLHYTNLFRDEKSVYLHFSASLTSGLFYSFASLPLDIAKTRMQKQKTLPDGTIKYRNTFQTLGYIAKHEGIFRWWKGFVPYFARSGTHTITLFIFLEQYRKIAAKFGYLK